MTEISAIILSVVLLSSTMSQSVFALGADTNSNMGLLTRDVVEKVLPTEMSKIDFKNVGLYALKNNQVQKIINGRPYQLMSQDIVGNTKTEPGIWYPEIHINVANETQVTVVLDSKNIVKSVESGTMISQKAQFVHTGQSFGTDYYTGTKQIDGIYMTATGTPTVNPSGNNNLGTYFLVNAIENGATDSNGCNPAFAQSSYFAQAGLAYIAGSTYLTYTDTTFSCQLQFISSSLIPYVAGHNYVMYIAVNQQNGRWYVYEQDVTSGGAIFYQTVGNIIPNSNVMKTFDTNTGVFLENHNTGTTWYTKYTLSSIGASAKIRQFNTSPWINWDADTQVDQDCFGVNHSYNYLGQVINSGTNLKNANTATWNFQNLANYHC